MSESSIGRKLIGSPILLQDWDDQAEEGAAQYWELFLDLLLVAAASSIADQFKENLDGHGLIEFTVFYLITVNGWLLYSHHITTRFEDPSLAHALVLFVYFVGFGGCIVNSSYQDATAFALGAILLRISILIMLATVAYCIPRARFFCAVLASVTVLAMLGLVATLVFGRFATSQALVPASLWFVALLELSTEMIVIHVADIRRMVPINIEKSKERLGALELIMLGETALSVTITYRELLADDGEEEKVGEEVSHHTTGGQSYYWVLGLSFLLIFMFTLLFFHMQPSPSAHAFRRSKERGTLVFIAHKLLGLALLTLGVSVKLVVKAVVLKEDLSVFASRLMGISVGAALVILLSMRYLHYGGISSISFGDKVMVWGEHAFVDRMATIWWGTVGVACVVPFLGVATGVTTGDPVVSTALHAGLLFLLCVVESYYSHTMQDALTKYSSAPSRSENENLIVSPVGTSYGGTDE